MARAKKKTGSAAKEAVKANGFDRTHYIFLTDIERFEGDIREIKASNASRVGKVKQMIRDTFKAAQNAGVPRSVLEFHLKDRAHKRERNKMMSSFDQDARGQLDLFGEMLAKYGNEDEEDETEDADDGAEEETNADRRRRQTKERDAEFEAANDAKPSTKRQSADEEAAKKNAAALRLGVSKLN